MKMFWGKRKTAKIEEEVAVSSAYAELTGLSLQLDNQGHVLQISKELKELLSISTFQQPLHLAELLAQHFLEITLPIAEWPSQLPMVFRHTTTNDPIYMHGSVFQHPSSWIIALFDNSKNFIRDSQSELRRKILSFSIAESTQLNTASNALLQSLAEKWLEGLMLRLQTPWLQLLEVNTSTGEWQRYAHANLPKSNPAPDTLKEIKANLANTPQPQNNELIRILIGTNKTSIILLPYIDQSTVSFWLAFPEANNQTRLYGLDSSDWIAAFHLFSTPLLAQKHNNNQQQTTERNKYLQKILESGWWEYHIKQKTIYMDQNLAATLGLQLNGDNSIEFAAAIQAIDPLDRLDFTDRLNRAVSEDSKLNMVVRLQANGSSSWFRMIAERTGCEKRLLGYAMNIDDLRQMETAVHDANERFEELIHHSPAIVYILSYKNETYEIDFCSSSIQPILGWTFDQVASMSLGQLVHPDDRQEYFEGLRQILHSGSITRRYRIRNSNNSYHWMLDEAKLLRDERGLPKEIIGLVIDITEATESAEQVKKSEECYRILVEDSPAIIFRHLPDLTITYGNKQLLKAFGISSEMPPNLNLGDFISPDKRQELLEYYANINPETPCSNREILLHLSDHVHAWWVLSDRALFDLEGNIIEIQSVARDTTEVHSARQQLNQSSKMAALGEMATGLAHEISQPLTVMHMALNNVSQHFSKNDDINKAYILNKFERLESQVKRASKIVDHMRIFGRNSEIKSTLFDPAETIHGAILLTQEGMRKKSVEMIVEKGLITLPKVEGHADRFEQVLINLLSNAKYAAARYAKTTQQKPWVSISTKIEENILSIFIEDNGGGIPNDLIERIFEPFITTKPAGKGTGLGLSISYNIINLMRGKLQVENSKNGAKFSIILPIQNTSE